MLRSQHSAVSLLTNKVRKDTPFSHTFPSGSLSLDLLFQSSSQQLRYHVKLRNVQVSIHKIDLSSALCDPLALCIEIFFLSSTVIDFCLSNSRLFSSKQITKIKAFTASNVHNAHQCSTKRSQPLHELRTTVLPLSSEKQRIKNMLELVQLISKLTPCALKMHILDFKRSRAF